jgi:hypothetical protein
MRVQRFAAAHNWTIIGETDIQKDRFARYYADGVRVALIRTQGAFTGLVCVDGETRYVMTSDWTATHRLPGTFFPAPQNMSNP